MSVFIILTPVLSFIFLAIGGAFSFFLSRKKFLEKQKNLDVFLGNRTLDDLRNLGSIEDIIFLTKNFKDFRDDLPILSELKQKFQSFYQIKENLNGFLDLEKAINKFGGIDGLEEKIRIYEELPFATKTIPFIKDKLEKLEKKAFILDSWGADENQINALKAFGTPLSILDKVKIYEELPFQDRKIQAIKSRVEMLETKARILDSWGGESEIGQLKNFGTAHSIYEKLGDFEILKYDMASLKTKFESLERENAGWLEFTKGKTLDQLKEEREQRRKKQIELQGNTENVKKVGNEFEKKTEEILEKYFPSKTSHLVKWKKEQWQDKWGRSDFIVTFINPNNLGGKFKVIIECKCAMDTDEFDEMEYPTKEEEEKIMKNQRSRIKKGIDQLWSYMTDEGANMGVLLTNSIVGDGHKDFEVVNLKEKLNRDALETDPVIFLVHIDYFPFLIWIISSINRSYYLKLDNSFELDDPNLFSDIHEYSTRIESGANAINKPLEVVGDCVEKFKKILKKLDTGLIKVKKGFDKHVGDVEEFAAKVLETVQDRDMLLENNAPQLPENIVDTIDLGEVEED